MNISLRWYLTELLWEIGYILLHPKSVNARRKYQSISLTVCQGKYMTVFFFLTFRFIQIFDNFVSFLCRLFFGDLLKSANMAFVRYKTSISLSFDCLLSFSHSSQLRNCNRRGDFKVTCRVLISTTGVKSSLACYNFILAIQTVEFLIPLRRFNCFG